MAITYDWTPGKDVVPFRAITDWRMIHLHLDFAKTPLAINDVAKLLVLPARSVLFTFPNVTKVEGGAATFTLVTDATSPLTVLAGANANALARLASPFGVIGAGTPVPAVNGVVAGKDGPGAITLTGAQVGDVVAQVVCLTTPADARSLFETVVTVAGQLQQTSASDLSAIKYLVGVSRAGGGAAIATAGAQSYLTLVANAALAHAVIDLDILMLAPEVVAMVGQL